MKIKILISLLLLIGMPITQFLGAAQPLQQQQIHDVKFASYPRDLKPIVQMIMRMPEIKSLVARAQQQGPISIKIEKGRKESFDGYWDPSNRTIVIDGNICRDPGKTLNTLVFEVHNAIATDRFNAINDLAKKGSINVDQFVRETEWIEHQNLLQCSSLITDGIRRGLLPQTARMPVIRDFEKHYQVQQLTGHSQYLAWSFDYFTPYKNQTYRGTIRGLLHMSAQEKSRLLNEIVSFHLEYPS